MDTATLTATNDILIDKLVNQLAELTGFTEAQIRVLVDYNIHVAGCWGKPMEPYARLLYLKQAILSRQ